MILKDRSELLKAAKKIHDKAKAEGRGFSADEQKKFDEILDEVDQINSMLEAGKNLESYESLNETSNANFLARSAKALYDGDFSEVNRGNVEDVMQRTATSTSFANAIQNPLVSSDEIIFSSLNQGFIQQLGVETINLQNYLSVPKVTAYPSFSAYTESEAVAVDDVTVGSVQFTVKNHGLIVKVHNNLLRDANERTFDIVQGAINRALQEYLLSQILFGSGATNSFTGLDSYTGIQTVDAGSATLTNHDKIVEAYTDLMGQNANSSNFRLLANNVLAKQFGEMKATDNQPLQKPMILQQMPFVYSQAVKSDYGSGSNETRAYIGDFSQVKIGVEGQYQMRLVERYADLDQTAFMLILRADLQLFEANHICRIENIATS